MKVNELIASLTSVSTNDACDVPVQVFDFTDIFQITEIELCRHYFNPSTIRLVTSSQTRKITAKELVSTLEIGRKLCGLDTLEIEVLLDDGTQYTLGGVEFDRRGRTYAITLGDKTSDQMLDKYTFFSFNEWRIL